ncbi:MAG: mechanosensitive ion channel family protein [Thermoanaerobaculia bacterium]
MPATLEDFLSRRLFAIGETDVTVSSVLVSLGILLGSWILARFARRVIADRLLARTRLDPGVRYALGRVIGYVILVLGALIAVQSLGVPTQSLAVFGGALGVGLGFGLQDLVKNFAAGLVLLIDRSVKVGDRIVVGDAVGEVVEIRARATIVRTNDDVHLIVPNANLISDTIHNWTFRSAEMRVRIPVGVAYGSDPRRVEEALLEAARGMDAILKTPAPSVWFSGFGESTLDFTLLCWTSEMVHRPRSLESELRFRVHETLAARGIDLPFPQRDLHIRSAAGLEELVAAGRPPDAARAGGTESAPHPTGR